MALQILKQTLNIGYSVYKKIEPYQPLITCGIIIGKFLWFQANYPKWNNDIQNLMKRIKRLNSLLANKKLSEPLSSSARKNLHSLRAYHLEKTRNFQLKKLTWVQIPSLFFPSFLFNIWNNSHLIVTRAITLKNIFKPITDNHQPPIQRAITITGSALSIIGTTTTLLKHMKMIPADHPLGHVLVGLAIGVSVIEITIQAKKWLGSRSLQRASSPIQVVTNQT